jgi:hypothetical protein
LISLLAQRFGIALALILRLIWALTWALTLTLTLVMSLAIVSVLTLTFSDRAEIKKD